MLEETNLQNILEAVILAAQKPMNEESLLALFNEEERPTKGSLRQALSNLSEKYQNRGIRLIEIASGYQFQVNPDYHQYIGKLWEEKPARYSRALLETLALIAYRQPISRGEIEDIRGVSLSSSIFKTLLEDREWIRVVGHREVPGRPALYATTKNFLDYFGLKSLENLPTLPEIMNLEGVSDKAEQALADNNNQLSLLMEEQNLEVNENKSKLESQAWMQNEDTETMEDEGIEQDEDEIEDEDMEYPEEDEIDQDQDEDEIEYEAMESLDQDEIEQDEIVEDDSDENEIHQDEIEEDEETESIS